MIGFDFIDPPSSESLISSLEQLYALGALNSEGDITTRGRTMAELPLDPMYSAAIIASNRNSCTKEVIIICSMLSSQGSLFFYPKDKKAQVDNVRRTFFGDHGDLSMLLKVFKEVFFCLGN